MNTAPKNLPTNPVQIHDHIQTRIHKSKIDSPPVHLSREAWVYILHLIRQDITTDDTNRQIAQLCSEYPKSAVASRIRALIHK